WTTPHREAPSRGLVPRWLRRQADSLSCGVFPPAGRMSVLRPAALAGRRALRRRRWARWFPFPRVSLVLSLLKRVLKERFRPVNRPGRPGAWQGRFLPAFESLTERILPAVAATFVPGTGTLTILGDAQNNAIVVSRDAAGQILINDGALVVQGGTPTVANTALIEVFGQDGDDTITLNEASGALPAAHLDGGAGNDTLTGGAGADVLSGGAGNDTLLGKGGSDILNGDDGNDTLTGGDADDQVFGGA